MSAPPSPTLSDSALLDSLEDSGFDLASHREQRMEALQSQIRKVQDLRETDYGKVLTFEEEKKLIEKISKEKYCLIHFFHPEFKRCTIMDQKLAALAPSHRHTLFARISVADTPFLVHKLNVQVLPYVMCFVDGKGVDRLIGFEELGDTDHFTSKMLEFRLKQSGVLPIGPLSLANNVSSSLLSGAGKAASHSDSERSDEEDGNDDRRARGGAGRAWNRKGKVGIRDGLAGAGSDDDE